MSAQDKGPDAPATETILTHVGRDPDAHFGFVNTPVYRGSTVLFKTLADLDRYTQPHVYGRDGNPTTNGVEAIVTALEGAHATHLVPSGLAAVTVALLASLKQGDELLMTDSVYEPTRNFCTQFLTRIGVVPQFYDARIGADIAALMTERTKAVFVESPGSGTFEVQDLPAIIAAARPRGVRVIVDNSWASPLFHNPLAMGADIVVHSGTKMFVGHADAFAGTVSATEAVWPDVKRTRKLLGLFTAGDEAFLAARGLRTLALRMEAHKARALEIAAWLEGRPGVKRVIHPGLPSHPDHALFKRDFRGSGSLFGIVLEAAPRPALAAMLDAMRLFAMGYSWGGYESLIVPVKPVRAATPWTEPGQLVRLHIGLEAVEDLKADLADGLGRFNAERRQ